MKTARLTVSMMLRDDNPAAPIGGFHYAYGIKRWLAYQGFDVKRPIVYWRDVETGDYLYEQTECGKKED